MTSSVALKNPGIRNWQTRKVIISTTTVTWCTIIKKKVEQQQKKLEVAVKGPGGKPNLQIFSDRRGIRNSYIKILHIVTPKIWFLGRSESTFDGNFSHKVVFPLHMS